MGLGRPLNLLGRVALGLATVWAIYILAGPDPSDPTRVNTDSASHTSVRRGEAEVVSSHAVGADADRIVSADMGPMALPGGAFDPATAIVMTVAEWDDGGSYERFVASLRWTGYTGKIVIGSVARCVRALGAAVGRRWAP